MRKDSYQKDRSTLHSWITALLLAAFTWGYASPLTVTPTVTGTCSGNDASVTFALTGGNTGTHYYSLYGGNGYYPSQTSPVFSGLAAGYYNVYVNGGTDSAYATFTIGSRISITPTVINTTCPVNQGSITTSVSGGTAPYVYTWSSGAGNVSSVSSLAGGPYWLTVTDATGCTAQIDSINVIATSPLTVGVTTSGPWCNQTFTALGANGTGAVSYHWSNNANGASITSLTAQTMYTVTATDANGCTAVHSQYYAGGNLNIDSSNGGSVSIQYPGCAASTGTITVHIRTGVAPYTWQWSGSSSTDSIAAGLATGYYSVTVTDANGCTGTGSYNIYTGNGMSANIYPVSNPACGASDGSIQAYAYGGSYVYTYAWSTGPGTAAVYSNLPAGTYTVTATDQNGCTATASYTLQGEATYSVNVSSTPTSCDTSQHTGTATAVVTGTGGTPPYSYVWHEGYSNNPVTLGTGQTITGLGASSFVVVNVTDANGCIPQRNTSYDSVYIGIDPACYNHITGYLYVDANSNCTHDAGEAAVTTGYIVVTGTGGTSYASADSTGFYDAYVLAGTYSVGLQLSGSGACVSTLCNSSYSVSFPSTGQTSGGRDFGVDMGSASFDLGVHPGCASSIPGGTKEYWVYYYNAGLSAAPGTVVSFIHDPDLTLVSTTPAYSTYDNATHTVSWNIGTMPGNLGGSWQVVRMIYNVPNTLVLGSYLTGTAQISPTTGDCSAADNISTIYDEVRGSHDPNEKEVYPAGPLAEGDTVLHYTVRFQNDGNAPAYLVVVKDTLSPYVDPASVVPGASSHPYKFSLSGNGLLTFRFENINLPDSVHDEPNSKGFVNYTVHTKPNLPLGTDVRNTAYIYFDYNYAVVTNTTVNTRSDGTGIHPVYGTGAMQVSVTPNPVQDQALVHFAGATGQVSFELMDVTGKKVMETMTSRDLTLSAEMFAAGIYTYIAKDQAGSMRSGKVAITH